MPEVDKIIVLIFPKLSPSIIMVTGVRRAAEASRQSHVRRRLPTCRSWCAIRTLQALRNSPVPVKVRLGQNGLGAGNNPEKGRQAALESLDEIVEIYKREGTKMVFITARNGRRHGVREPLRSLRKRPANWEF